MAHPASDVAARIGGVWAKWEERITRAAEAVVPLVDQGSSVLKGHSFSISTVVDDAFDDHSTLAGRLVPRPLRNQSAIHRLRVDRGVHV
jgi:hypothetical protein